VVIKMKVQVKNMRFCSGGERACFFISFREECSIKCLLCKDMLYPLNLISNVVIEVAAF